MFEFDEVILEDDGGMVFSDDDIMIFIICMDRLRMFNGFMYVFLYKVNGGYNLVLIISSIIW